MHVDRRYIVMGAGAVGASIGGMLHRAGAEVLLVARGAHGEALRQDGLRLVTPGGELRLDVPTVGDPADLEPSSRDAVVLLAVKSQDTAGAVEALARSLPPDTPIVCAQNGVDNEPRVAERFARVYGMMVWMPALHIEPGAVELYAAEPGGMLRLGPHPAGGEELGDAIAADLRGAGFDAEQVADISRWKHGKLLTNSSNAMDAYVDGRASHRPVFDALLAEGAAVLAAAGIPFKPPVELIAEMRERTNWDNRTIDGQPRPGGSTWQSVVRGAPVESAHFNGYLCRLGAEHGVATPLNRALLEIAAESPEPRSIPLDRLYDALRAGQTGPS